MMVFRSNLRRAIGFSSQYRDDVWGLSVDAGLGKKTIYNILREGKARLQSDRSGDLWNGSCCGFARGHFR